MLERPKAKWKTVIVEDNLASFHALKEMLADFPDLEFRGAAHDGKEAVRFIQTEKPDLLFLDIELPELNGFEVLKSIQHPPLVIFVSAYGHYALKAFEANGIDYILKPVTKERLEAAIAKATSRTPYAEQALEKLIRDILQEQRKHDPQRFAVKEREQILIIPQEEVCFFKAEDKYVFLHTHDKQYFYNATLKDLEATLDPADFIRINKSYIVALNKIEKIKKTLDQGHKIIVNDLQKTSVKVSKNYMDQLKKQLNLR